MFCHFCSRPVSNGRDCIATQQLCESNKKRRASKEFATTTKNNKEDEIFLLIAFNCRFHQHHLTKMSNDYQFLIYAFTEQFPVGNILNERCAKATACDVINCQTFRGTFKFL